jgi:hypothetical protein
MERMIPAASGNRPSIQAIQAGQYLQAPPGKTMSERDVADLLAPLSGGLSGAAFYGAMKAGQSLGTALGLRAGKRTKQPYVIPYPPVVLVLALRRAIRELTALYDTAWGSVVKAKLPTDIFSFGGTLACEILDLGPSQTTVRGNTEIKGQLFDLGKGARALRDLFETTTGYLRRMGWRA